MTNVFPSTDAQFRMSLFSVFSQRAKWINDKFERDKHVF